MPEDWIITDEGSFLRFDFVGRFSIDSGKACVDAMVDACVKQHCSRVLLDCRKMKGDMPLFAQFYVAVYAKRTRDASMRTALVGREDQVIHGKFVDNVAMISGVDARVFSELDGALRWLQT
jgi:hypothetical protein